MLERGFLKPIISIDKIGVKQFWLGIVFGISMSIILASLFGYMREVMRLVTTYNADIIMLLEAEYKLYDLFFVSIATALGFSFTIIYWFRGNIKYIKRRYLKEYVVTNSWILFLIPLMFISRFGYVLTINVYGVDGYGGDFDFLGDFWLLMLIAPIYVFLGNWNIIRLIFRSKKWYYLSIIIAIITTIVIYMTPSVNRNTVDDAYYNRHKDRYHYVDSEIERASKYGVVINDSTQQLLKKIYLRRTYDLVNILQQEFENNAKVSLEVLFLEKIVLHNTNKHTPYFNGRRLGDIDLNWSYVYPEEIYYQIHRNDLNSIETQILFEILAEQIFLFAEPEIDLCSNIKYTFYERERSSYRRHLLWHTSTIQSRLIQVVQKLKSDTIYAQYHYLLPEMEFKDERRQEYIDISDKL